MAQQVFSGTPILLSSTGTVSLVPGTLIGFYVNSTSSGTIVINNDTTAVSGTITPAIGWHFWPAYFTASCKVTIGATISVTFMFAAG